MPDIPMNKFSSNLSFQSFLGKAAVVFFFGRARGSRIRCATLARLAKHYHGFEWTISWLWLNAFEVLAVRGLWLWLLSTTNGVFWRHELARRLSNSFRWKSSQNSVLPFQFIFLLVFWRTWTRRFIAFASGKDRLHYSRTRDDYLRFLVFSCKNTFLLDIS